MRTALAAALAAGMFAVVACSTTPGSNTPPSATTTRSTTPPSATATHSATPPSATPTAPATPPGQLPDLGILSYGDECPDAMAPQVYNGAAPYQGRGPHPVAFVDPSDTTALNNFFEDAPNPNNQTPDGTFSAEPHDWIPPNVASVQLVACVVDNDANSTTTPAIAYDCGMYKLQGGGGTVDIGIAYDSYTITLVNAMTGKRVAGPVTITGQQIPNCPSKISYPSDYLFIASGPNPFYHTIISASQAESAFGRYIDATV